MKSLQEWIDRKPAGPKPKKRIERRTPLPRATKRIASVGAKAKREAPGYRAASLAHLTEFPRCQIGPVFKAAGIDVLCLDTATHVHHSKGRGKYLCDRSTFFSSCSGECHPRAVHELYVAEARALGLLQNR